MGLATVIIRGGQRLPGAIIITAPSMRFRGGINKAKQLSYIHIRRLKPLVSVSGKRKAKRYPVGGEPGLYINFISSTSLSCTSSDPYIKYINHIMA